jgi:hypothetical protein
VGWRAGHRPSEAFARASPRLEQRSLGNAQRSGRALHLNRVRLSLHMLWPAVHRGLDLNQLHASPVERSPMRTPRREHAPVIGAIALGQPVLASRAGRVASAVAPAPTGHGFGHRARLRSFGGGRCAPARPLMLGRTWAPACHSPSSGSTSIWHTPPGRDPSTFRPSKRGRAEPHRQAVMAGAAPSCLSVMGSRVGTASSPRSIRDLTRPAEFEARRLQRVHVPTLRSPFISLDFHPPSGAATAQAQPTTGLDLGPEIIRRRWCGR